MEKIISIKEVTGFKSKKYSDWSSFDGYEIETDKQVIKLGIANGQSCCESWGYFMTNDDVNDFVDAELLKIETVDEILNVEKLVDTYDGGCMFVNLTTSKGVLQFVAYNSHNGYYGHTAIVESTQFSTEETL